MACRVRCDYNVLLGMQYLQEQFTDICACDKVHFEGSELTVSITTKVNCTTNSVLCDYVCVCFDFINIANQR